MWQWMGITLYKFCNVDILLSSEAFKTLNLVMISIDTIKSNEDLVKKNGFICNSSDHWFSLRKIDGVWYNLNSTNKRMP